MARKKKKAQQKKRVRGLKENEWVALPLNKWVALPSKPVRRPVEPERDETEVRLACELVLMFMLLHRDRRSSKWWLSCQLMAMERPAGSWSHVFFWSMRTLGDRLDDEVTLDDFREYLAWKWEEYESGRLHREGPRWA